MSVCSKKKQRFVYGGKLNTHQTLIQRVQNPEDTGAWDEFVKYYETFIKMVLKKSNIPFNEADDLVQDILLKVWKGLPVTNIAERRPSLEPGWVQLSEIL